MNDLATHQFIYKAPASEIIDIVPRTITFDISGDATLPNLVEQFEYYLKATGYFPPDGCHLDWVEDEK